MDCKLIFLHNLIPGLNLWLLKKKIKDYFRERYYTFDQFDINFMFDGL